jgi:dTDP-4-dehydrorhamnose reductase
VYGRSKAEAERRVLDSDPQALVIRTSAFFGPWDEHNFVGQALDAIGNGRPFAASADQVVSPTYVPDLVNVALDLLIDKECGVWHLTNGEAMSWAELARRTCAAAGIEPATLEEAGGEALGQRAPRPLRSALGSERGMLLPSFEDALGRYLREREGRVGALRQLISRLHHQSAASSASSKSPAPQGPGLFYVIAT